MLPDGRTCLNAPRVSRSRYPTFHKHAVPFSSSFLRSVVKAMRFRQDHAHTKGMEGQWLLFGFFSHSQTYAKSIVPPAEPRGSAGPRREGKRRSLLPGSKKRPIPQVTGRRQRPGYTGSPSEIRPGPAAPHPPAPGRGKGISPQLPRGKRGPQPQGCGGRRRHGTDTRTRSPPGTRVGTSPGAPGGGGGSAACPSRRGAAGKPGLPQG